VSDDVPSGARRRVRRGEGEVTSWPRGLVDYVPAGPDDATPPEDEDRDLNRLKIAARLLGTARAQGHPVDAALVRLRAAEREFRAGERAKGRRLVDEVISAAEELLRSDEGGAPPAP